MTKRTEAQIQRDIQLALSDAGSLMYRNNCGQYTTQQGHKVRYGVGNPGGSDLIGITPVTITDDMVGKTIGVFTAVEVKAPGGEESPDQIRFVDTIQSLGGFSGFAYTVLESLEIVRRYRMYNKK